MTQIEREEFVERYLAGEMNQAQESEFFLHVAVDDELQRTLRAFRIMDQAIRNDCETVVPERSNYRENIMAVLAATQVVAGGGIGAGLAGSASSSAGAASSTAGASSAGLSASSGVAATAGTAATTGASVTGMAAGTTGIMGVLGMGVWKMVMLAVIGGMLAVGTTLLVSHSGSNEGEVRSIPGATSPSGLQPNAVTGERPSQAPQQTVAPDAASAPASTEGGVKSELHDTQAPAMRSGTESPAETRDTKANALKLKENRGQEGADVASEPAHQREGYIRLDTTSTRTPVSILVDKPNGKAKKP